MSKRKKKFPSIKKYFLSLVDKQQYPKPSELKRKYEEEYPEAKIRTLTAYQLMMQRAGFDKETRVLKRVEKRKEASTKDILEYEQVKAYIENSTNGGVQQTQIKNQLRNLRKIWELMGKTDPLGWTYTDLMTKIKEVVPMVEVHGRLEFSVKGRVKSLLSPVSTMFVGILPKNWSQALTRKAGELKDHFTFYEYEEFKKAIVDSIELSMEGWIALFDCQVNLGCREGTQLDTGILSLKWQDINYKAKTCKLREKGGRGNAKRQWKNLPLDLFVWLNGWDNLMKYHKQKFGYIPTDQNHEKGRVFPIKYAEYLKQFHVIRKGANGRISGKGETLRPHILRKTHANWCAKIGIPIELICGNFPNGQFGVGWDNPMILMKYYLEEADASKIEKTKKDMNERMVKLGLV